jgi:hypothetical protein
LKFRRLPHGTVFSKEAVPPEKTVKPGLFVLLIILSIPIHSELGWPFIEEGQHSIEAVAMVPEEPKYFVLETLTIYHPVEGQCDDSPLITASNARIDLDKLRQSEIRWMALSRNLLKKWKGEFNYGDTVMLKSGDPDIDGLWVINDNMNKRFKDRGDLLFHQDARKIGLWKNVKIAKRPPKVVG